MLAATGGPRGKAQDSGNVRATQPGGRPTSDARTLTTAAARALWRIPPLPGTVTLLLSTQNDDSQSLEQAARIVSLDEVLASHTLRMANSAALGFRSPTNTIQQAVLRLGCATVRSLVLTQLVSRAVPLMHEVGGVPRVGLWEHNWAVATVCAGLSALGGVSRGEAHICGLLHDVGKLVLASWAPEAYEDCVRVAGEAGVDLPGAERATMGVDHGEVGAAALRAWGLPEEPALGAGQHHAVQRGEEGPLIARLVCAADAIAHAANLGVSGNALPMPLEQCREVCPGLTEAKIDQWLAELDRQRQGIAELAQQLAGDRTAAKTPGMGHGH